MATHTKNLSLVKPDNNDIVDVSVINNNYDKIDSLFGYSTEEKMIGTWVDGRPVYGGINTKPTVVDVDIFNTEITVNGVLEYEVVHVDPNNPTWRINIKINGEDKGDFYYKNQEGAIIYEDDVIKIIPDAVNVRYKFIAKGSVLYNGTQYKEGDTFFTGNAGSWWNPRTINFTGVGSYIFGTYSEYVKTEE